MLIRAYRTQHLKFMKSFVNAVVQIILHSRLATKSNSGPRVSRMTKSFGLMINDFPSGIVDIKNKIQSCFESQRVYMCIELFLKFPDNSHIILEKWILEITPRRNPSCLNMTSNEISQMPGDAFSEINSLLKSIISLSRVMPAYRVVRTIHDDTCKVCYRINSAEIEDKTMQKGMKKIVLHRESAFIGNITITILYKNEMFKSETEIRVVTTKTKVSDENRIVDLDQPLKMGALVTLSSANIPDMNFPEVPATSWLLDYSSSVNKCDIPSQDVSEETENEEPVEIFNVASKDVAEPIWIMEQPEDDLFKNELNCAFGDRTELVELAAFFRKFNKAPTLLETYNVCPELLPGLSNEDVDERLEYYENSSEVYNEMMKNIEQSNMEY